MRCRDKMGGPLPYGDVTIEYYFVFRLSSHKVTQLFIKADMTSLSHFLFIIPFGFSSRTVMSCFVFVRRWFWEANVHVTFSAYSHLEKMAVNSKAVSLFTRWYLRMSQVRYGTRLTDPHGMGPLECHYKNTQGLRCGTLTRLALTV